MSPPTWVHVTPFSAYTRTWPALLPPSSLKGAPIATRVPSADIETLTPNWSPVALPSMSEPIWVHVPPLSAYTRTWPASEPLPSFVEAPIATRVPSEDIDTETPDRSPPASPLMVSPILVQFPPLSEYTRTWPALFPYEPIATRVPSVDIDTETPDPSPAASPSILEPICVHVYVWSNRRARSISSASATAASTEKRISQIFILWLGLRYGPATRARTDRRRISAVLWSQTPGFEEVVRDRAFSAHTDFQSIPCSLTDRPCRAPGHVRAPL